MCVWSQQVYSQNIKDLRGSWEEGRKVHCRVVILMEAQFQLWVSGEAALLPFCYCSGQLDSPQTLSSQLHIAATTYWSSLSLWDPLAMTTYAAPLCLHGDQQQCLLASSLLLWGCELWLPTHLSTEINRMLSANGSFTTKLRRFSLIHLLNNSLTFAVSCCLICTIWWNTMEICKFKME